jgi:hypothetical protein
VELSFAIVLLLVVVFGIITFGLILSFNQGMTQAAAEGARAAAVAPLADAEAVAAVATARSVEASSPWCSVTWPRARSPSATSRAPAWPPPGSCCGWVGVGTFAIFFLLPFLGLFSSFGS